MKFYWLLILAGAVSGQAPNSFRPQQHRFGQQRQGGFNQGGGGPAIDHSTAESDYHFSFVHAGFNTHWPWSGANQYCRSLGPGWGPININNGAENSFVVSTISQRNLPWIWTGGQRGRGGFVWGDGSPVVGGGWSRTGGNGRPQPDNREGNESCLAVLNNVYRDGITWHDVGCSHRKPTICERRRF